MKHLIAAGTLLACLGGSSLAGGEGWTSDFEAAKKQAAEQDKDLLLDFTGSDWCGWCIKLVDEVFSKDPFKEGVKDDFVLVELDFPRDESKLSDETKKQNETLQQSYGIEGFPTIVLADAKGRPYATTGYREGGAEKYVEHLDELSQRRVARDEAFKKADAAEGPAKAKLLVAALEDLPDPMVANFYGDVIKQIKAADPDDESGFVKQQEQTAALGKIEDGLREYFVKQDLDGALAYLVKAVDEAELEGEARQQALAMKVVIFANQQKFDKALEALDEVEELAPDSELAKQLTMFREKLEEAKQEQEAGAGEKPAEDKSAEKPEEEAAAE